MLRYYHELPRNNPQSRANEIAYLGNSFNDYLDRMPKELRLRQLHTFSRKLDSEEALGRIEKMSFIYFLETFNEDMLQLFNILGLSKPNFHHDMQSKYEFTPTKDERSRLRELLEPEYQLLEQVRKIKASQQ
jgi:hypothetical protein